MSPPPSPYPRHYSGRIDPNAGNEDSPGRSIELEDRSGRRQVASSSNFMENMPEFRYVVRPSDLDAANGTSKATSDMLPILKQPTLDAPMLIVWALHQRKKELCVWANSKESHETQQFVLELLRSRTTIPEYMVILAASVALAQVQDHEAIELDDFPPHDSPYLFCALLEGKHVHAHLTTILKDMALAFHQVILKHSDCYEARESANLLGSVLGTMTTRDSQECQRYWLSILKETFRSVEAYESLMPLKEDVLRILGGDDLLDILRLAQFWPYADRELLRTTLLDRPILDDLLNMAGVDTQGDLGMPPGDAKLEYLRRSFSAPWKQPVFHPRQTIKSTSEQIAATIIKDSWHQFLGLSFEDLVQHTLGHQVPSVEDFVRYHMDTLPTLISLHLDMSPNQIEIYSQAALIPSDQDFFAQSALNRGIQLHKRWKEQEKQVHRPLRLEEQALDPSTISSQFSGTYNVIITAIQEVLLESSCSLERKLRRLAILSHRFRRWSPDMPGNESLTFSPDTQLTETVVDMLSPRLAELITGDDVASFRNLSLQAMMNEEGSAKDIAISSNKLALACLECALLGPHFMKKCLDLAEALYAQRNYNSLWAVVTGLRLAGFEDAISPHIDLLTQDANNWAKLRKAMARGPCLPFLFPYKREAQYKDRIVAAWRTPLFASIRYCLEHPMSGVDRSKTRHDNLFLSWIGTCLSR